MMSKEAKKAHAAFDELEDGLKRLVQFPPDALTLEEKLEVWAMFEMLHLKLTDAVRRGRADDSLTNQKPGS